MEIEAKNRQIANSYYNMGLERARLRDLRKQGYGIFPERPSA